MKGTRVYQDWKEEEVYREGGGVQDWIDMWVVCKSAKVERQTVCGDKINWGVGGAVGNKMKGG